MRRAANIISTALLGAALLTVSGLAVAAERIGLSLPLTGRFAPVAERVEFGAQMALRALKASGRSPSLTLAVDSCQPSSDLKALEKLKSAEVEIVIGPLCFQSGLALARGLNSAEKTVPVVLSATRNPQLERRRSVDQLPLFELSSPPDAEAQAVVDLILPAFRDVPFAIVDDGSVYGRGLADQIRLLGEESGLRPVITTNFRPLQTKQVSLLRRLQRSGVRAIFIAAGPEDVVTIARDAKALGLDWQLATGEAALLLPFTEGARGVSKGLLMVRSRDLPTDRAGEIIKQLQADEQDIEDSLLLGYALVQLASQWPAGVADVSGRTFETVIGDIAFDENGRFDPAPFALYRWDGGAFQRAEAGAQ